MAKTFIHHDIPKIIQINENGTRTYKTSTGQKYPSVTSILSWYTAPDIQKWRAKVGKEEANKITQRAAKRGTSIHSLCEKYLCNERMVVDIFDQEMFNSLIPFLDRIDNIHCLETGLFSHKFKVAGTVDCIAEFDGKLRVIDFKSSAKFKEPRYAENYFMQTSIYAYMWWTITQIPISKALIIIGVDDSKTPQTFEISVSHWLQKFISVRKLHAMYYSSYFK